MIGLVMRMRTRGTVFLALVVALVLGVGAVAPAVTAGPTIKAWPKVVTYPNSARLVISTDTTPAAVMRRLAGSSEWTTYTASIETTLARVFVSRPATTAAYMVVSGTGAQSNVVTIGVAAQLSKPRFVGHGHKGKNITVRGWIAPAHGVDATVGLSFYHWQKRRVVTTRVVTFGPGGRKHKIKTTTVIRFGWVCKTPALTVDLTLAPKNQHKSQWTYDWTPAVGGQWKVVVSHQDVEHVRSAAGATVRVRH